MKSKQRDKKRTAVRVTRAALTGTTMSCLSAAWLLSVPNTRGAITAGPTIPPPTSTTGYTNLGLEGFDEQQSVVLAVARECDPGGYFLDPGATYDSHMIMFNRISSVPDTDTRRFSFDGMIVGVMADQDGIFEDNSPDFDLPGTAYPGATPFRGLEASVDDGYLIVGNTIELTSTVSSFGDYVRVITRQLPRRGITFSIAAGGPTVGLADPWMGTIIDPGSILTVGDAAGEKMLLNPPVAGPTATPPGVLVEAAALKLDPGVLGHVELDALSYGRDVGNRFVFSVDPSANGQPGSALENQSSNPLEGASADVFAANGAGGNVLRVDGEQLGLIEPPGDDLDALDLDTKPPHLMRRVYFSLDNSTAAANGFQGGDILVFDVRTGTIAVYVSHAVAGLVPADNLDAVAVADNGDGIYDPTVDRVFYSISDGSPTIGTADCNLGVPITCGDILCSPQQYGYPAAAPPAIHVLAADLGLFVNPYDDLNALDRIPGSAGQIDDINPGPNGVEIAVSALPGERVGIQYSSDLGEGSWIKVGEVTVPGDRASFIDDDPARLGRKNGFYRTVEPD